jgi:hypothetical protein
MKTIGQCEGSVVGLQLAKGASEEEERADYRMVCNKVVEAKN